MSEAPNMPERIWMGSLVNGGEGKSYVRDDIHHADVHAAVKRAIEACAQRIEPHPDHDKADWSEYAWEKHRNALYIRAIASDPEAIAKIIGGDA